MTPNETIEEMKGNAAHLLHQLDQAKAGIERLRAALSAIRNRGCQNFTTGIGSCYRNGKSETSKNSADRCCDACIADKALSSGQQS